MALTIVDFIEQVDGLTVDDVPPKVRKRINNALAGLEGGSGGEGSPDNSDTVLVSKNLNGRTGFNSIQAAIDSVSTDQASSTTVVVEKGTYDETVTVNKGVTLFGPNFGTAGTDPSRLDEAIIDGQLLVEADNVSVDGFDVSPPPAVNNSTGEAVRISGGADGVTVQNTIVRDFTEDGVGEWEGLDGIVAFGGLATDAVTDVTIRDNLVTRIDGRPTKGGAAGISVQGNVSSATVTGNTISEIGEEETAYSFGVVVRRTSNDGVTQDPSEVTIKENSISAIRSNPATTTLGVGIENEADATEITATNNNVSDVELFAENKDSDNTLDVSENWWGDVAGPDSSKLLGVPNDIEGDRGAIKTSPFLDAPFDEGGQPVYGGAFVSPGPNLIDFSGDGSYGVDVLSVSEPPAEGLDVRITSGGTSSSDFGTSAVRLSDPPTLGDVTGGTTLTYDYYERAANTDAAPDEVWLLLRETSGTTHVLYRTSNDGTSGESLNTRDVGAEVAGNPENNVGYNWFEITDGGRDNLGDGGATSDLSTVYSDDTEIVAIGAGRGTGSGAVSDVYYGSLTVGSETLTFPGR